MSKSGIKSKSREDRGPVKYFHNVEKKHVEDGQVEIYEESVVLGDSGFFAKLYIKSNDKITKYEIKSSPSGGEYSLRVVKDGDETKSTHNKAELIEFLKKNKSLAFVLEYLKKTVSLARPKAKKSDSKTKKASSKTKTSKPKSKSKSKSKSKK